MNTYEFLKMAEKEVADSLAIIRKKGESYGAAEDVFFNFRQTAARMFPEMPIHEGMFLVAEVLKDKHSVALAKGMYVNECRERLLDNLNYTLFQLAMIAEAEQMEEFNTNATEIEAIAKGIEEVAKRANAVKRTEVAPEPEKVEVVAQKKAPVIMYCCHNCKFSEYPSYSQPCDTCGGFNCEGVGQELPGWEPENG